MRTLLFISTFGIGIICFGQELVKEQIIERRIEFIGDYFEDSDLDLTTYFDDLMGFLEMPLNLNTANSDDLFRLQLLTDIQILNLINYRTEYGDLVSVFELSAIEGFNPITIEMMLPFVSVLVSDKKKIPIGQSLKYGRHEIISRYERNLQQKAGYDEVADSILEKYPNREYLGSADKLYFRYRFTFQDKISWGITAEKDAGERLAFNEDYKGFDFYSGHLFLKDVWKFKKIAIGDYQVNFGQGLTFWTGFGLGKTANISSANRHAAGLKAYTSVNENRFLRGAGFNIEVKDLDFTAFASHRTIDANLGDIDSLNEDFAPEFTSFQQTGYHRTAGQLEDKDAITENLVGGELAYKRKKFRIGLSGVYSQFSQNYAGNPADYNKFKFSGNELFTAGLNYRFVYRKLNFFGETAMSDNLKLASVNGITWQMNSRLDFMSIYRNYDKAYQTLYGAGFGESSSNAGEVGIYFGANARLSSKFNFTTYYDQFKFTYLKWQTDDYSEGREFFAELNYFPRRSSHFYVRLRNKITERNSQLDHSGLKSQTEVNKTSIRFNYSQEINKRWTIKTRVEWVNYQFDKDIANGVLFFQDVILKLFNLPMKIYWRYAIFDTDSYDARIYAYENDLLGVFSIPSYYNKGIRTYLMLRYDIGNKIDVWLRYDLWSYANQKDISSGLEKINGSEKSTVKIQLKIKI
ncbi:ComEA family DNA-binding protein [Crocinitomix catalasitica]|uniref:ComEA family DNA-binding protein n=1 Tax=Crocinitomix catalasitica TaxID=184607 RepID=UPI0004877736|nr:helix-hairpin-helix domain-containing protein [Crocinitomix catalasitica]